jgi:hypothetical protein
MVSEMSVQDGGQGVISRAIQEEAPKDTPPVTYFLKVCPASCLSPSLNDIWAYQGMNPFIGPRALMIQSSLETPSQTHQEVCFSNLPRYLSIQSCLQWRLIITVFSDQMMLFMWILYFLSFDVCFFKDFCMFLECFWTYRLTNVIFFIYQEDILHIPYHIYKLDQFYKFIIFFLPCWESVQSCAYQPWWFFPYVNFTSCLFCSNFHFDHSLWFTHHKKRFIRQAWVPSCQRT